MDVCFCDARFVQRLKCETNLLVSRLRSGIKCWCTWKFVLLKCGSENTERLLKTRAISQMNKQCFRKSQTRRNWAVCEEQGRWGVSLCYERSSRFLIYCFGLFYVLLLIVQDKTGREVNLVLLPRKRSVRFCQSNKTPIASQSWPVGCLFHISLSSPRAVSTKRLPVWSSTRMWFFFGQWLFKHLFKATNKPIWRSTWKKSLCWLVNVNTIPRHLNYALSYVILYVLKYRLPISHKMSL